MIRWIVKGAFVGLFLAVTLLVAHELGIQIPEAVYLSVWPSSLFTMALTNPDASGWFVAQVLGLSIGLNMAWYAFLSVIGYFLFTKYEGLL